MDGVETNTGTLVDEEDTGTDPHNRDTDGDNYGDGGEIAGGTNPHDPNSKGALLPPFLYVDFEEEAEDLSGNGYNGVVDGLVSFDVEGAPDGPTPRTGASFTGGHIDFPDIDMNSMINAFEDVQLHLLLLAQADRFCRWSGLHVGPNQSGHPQRNT